MVENLQLSMNTVFRDAVRQNIVSELRTDDDWKAYDTIKKDAEQAEAAKQSAFEEERPELLATAREEIMRQAGSNTYEHPTPLGTATDGFDKDRINAEAKRRVDGKHEAEMAEMREAEAKHYLELKAAIHVREQRIELRRDQAKDAFVRASDRRTGEDRRGPTRSR